MIESTLVNREIMDSTASQTEPCNDLRKMVYVVKRQVVLDKVTNLFNYSIVNAV